MLFDFVYIEIRELIGDYTGRLHFRPNITTNLANIDPKIAVLLYIYPRAFVEFPETAILRMLINITYFIYSIFKFLTYFIATGIHIIKEATTFTNLVVSSPAVINIVRFMVNIIKLFICLLCTNLNKGYSRVECGKFFNC